MANLSARSSRSSSNINFLIEKQFFPWHFFPLIFFLGISLFRNTWAGAKGANVEVRYAQVS